EERIGDAVRADRDEADDHRRRELPQVPCDRAFDEAGARRTQTSGVSTAHCARSAVSTGRAQLVLEAAARGHRRAVIAAAPETRAGHGSERRVAKDLVRQLDESGPADLSPTVDDETTDRPSFLGFP